MSIVVSALLLTMLPQTTAAERADKFALDLSGTDGVAAPPVPTPPQPAVSTEAPPAADPAPPAAMHPGVTHYSLDTPIADLIADPAAKAVLDKDMPGLSSDENLPKFRTLSLRKLAPLSGGQISAELMDTLAFDLAALAGGAPPPAPKKRAGPSTGR